MTNHKKTNEESINQDQIRKQLDKILASEDFQASESISTFLRFVVEETLEGRADQIKGYTIAVKAFGRPADFNPQIDTIIRTQARRLRRSLEIYYLADGRDDLIRITMPKGAYIPKFELQGKFREQRSEQASNAKRSAFEVNKSSNVQSDGINNGLFSASIAVLPLVSLSTDPDDACIADGLTEEFSIALNRFAEIEVIGPLNRLRGQQVESRQIGEEYRVRFVLQGSVRRRGTMVRISPSLNDTATGKIIWGDTFEFDLEKNSLFEIEDQVTAHVVGTIADGYGVVFRKLYPETHHIHIQDSNVTDAVVKYHHSRITLNPVDVAQANEALEKNLNDQPDNPLLLAMLAGNYYGNVLLDFNTIPDAAQKAQEMVSKAVHLDPKLQVARSTNGSVHGLFGRLDKCVDESLAAVSLNPHRASVLGDSGFRLAMAGEWETGIEMIEKSMQLNPHFPSWIHFVTFMYQYHLGDFQKAREAAQQFIAPGLFWHPLIHAAVLAQLGMLDEAGNSLQELLQLKQDFPVRGREVMKRLIYLDENVDMLWEGLIKVGLKE